MMKFFRKIREKRLIENKFSKYLLYAIGEIVLVVFGILIALSINNWNEKRKKENLEIILLSELVKNLQDDIIDMKINLGFHERGIKSAEIILSVFEEPLPYQDSLNRHYGKVSLIPKFLPIKTAYNSINRQGMRIIKNDSLRNTIIFHYENQYKFLEAWNESEWDLQFQDNREIYRSHFSKFQVYGDLVPLDYDNLRENQQYINYLNNRLGWLEMTVDMYQNELKGVEELILVIEKEIAHRNMK
jgi:hypothetical protein